MIRQIIICVLTILIWAPLIGCAEIAKTMGTTWHQKCGWKAEDYFDDAKVVALCHAIEADDLKEMDRLIADGANVNAQGKGKMTPLLWAYPDNKLERFKILLEHGANPNVVIENDFNTHGGMEAGDSVTHMACKTSFPGYFEAVFENAGDPNLRLKKLGYDETPIFTLIKGSSPNKVANIKLLIKKGADVNYFDGSGFTPAMIAVGFMRQYDIALQLLQAGADPNVYTTTDNSRLIHTLVAVEQSRNTTWTPKNRAEFDALVKWLKEHGQSMEDATADWKRWGSWSQTTGEYGRKMAAEVAARKAKEAREAAAKKAAAEQDGKNAKQVPGAAASGERSNPPASSSGKK